MIKPRKIVPFIIAFALDMLAMVVSVMAGFLAMPLGGLYGSLFIGAMVFTITWRSLGNSRKFWTKKAQSAIVIEKGDQKSRHP